MEKDSLGNKIIKLGERVIKVYDGRYKKSKVISSPYKNKIKSLLKSWRSKNKVVSRRAGNSLLMIVDKELLNNDDIKTLFNSYDFEYKRLNTVQNSLLKHINRFKSSIKFRVADVQTPLHSAVFEADIVPYKLPEYDLESVDKFLKDYFYAAVGCLSQYIKNTLNSSLFNYNFILEIHNNNDNDRWKPFTAATYELEWNSINVNAIYERVAQFIISKQIQDLLKLTFRFKGYKRIMGGAISKSLMESIYKKRSIIKMTNPLNECFWWSFSLYLNRDAKNYDALKDLSKPNRLKVLAKADCVYCGYDYNEPVDINSFHDIIEKICDRDKKRYFNIAVIDSENLPLFNTTCNIYNNIIFKTTFNTSETLFLLLDDGHYSPILDIKKFLNVRGFCNRCFTAFYKLDGLKNHDCEEFQNEYIRKADLSDSDFSEEESGECLEGNSGDDDDESQADTLKYLRKGYSLAKRDNKETKRYLRRGEAGGSSDIYVGDECENIQAEEINKEKAKHLLRKKMIRIQKLKEKVGNFRKDRRLFLSAKKPVKTSEMNIRYILYDIETLAVGKELIHTPDCVVAYTFITKGTSDTHTVEEAEDIVDNQLEPTKFEGKDCIGNFCDWVASQESNITDGSSRQKEYSKTICIAHNARGYDARFILKYMDTKNIKPKTIRANGGSFIQQISLKNGSIKFIDSLNFFCEPLESLAKTYNIKNTVKGWFPYGFMTEENLNYIGSIPPIEYFHPKYIKIINGKSKLDFSKYEDLKAWHEEQVNNNVVYNFREEMIKYCIDDVKLLAKAVLIFRSIIINKQIKNAEGDYIPLNIDPFAECITLPSLALKINRQNFIIPNTIECYTDSKKRDSKKSMGWLYHISQNKKNGINTEFNLKVVYSPQTNSISANVYDRKISGILPDGFKFEYHFKNKNIYASLSLDAYDSKTNTIYEFYGDYWHGNPDIQDYKESEIAQVRHEKTMEREAILKILGFNLITIYENEWNFQLNNFSEEYKKEVNDYVENQYIDVRDALHGGRTEVFQTVKEAKREEGEFIFCSDISSQYPSVMAMDEYAVGCKKIAKYQSIEMLERDLLNNRFCGLVKCDITPPTDLFLPVISSNNGERSVFDLLPKEKITIASPELKLALEKGYKITKIYNCYKYKPLKGLFKKYVECFYKMKIENSEHYSVEQCEAINASFKRQGLDIEIKSEDTRKNVGLRAVAKMMLNSHWGKYSSREIMSDYTYVRTKSQFYKIAGVNSKTKLINFNTISDNLIEVQHSRDPEFTDPADYISPITGVFTTSNARVRLYRFLDMLHPSQLLYCDTDSCYYSYNPNNPLHVKPADGALKAGVEIGDSLGAWEEELNDCVEFVATGAKTKAGICVNPKNNFLNAKGLTIDYLNRNIITFNNMKKVAGCMNEFTPEQQRVLHNKNYLEENGIRVNEPKTDEQLLEEVEPEDRPEEKDDDKKLKFIESAKRFQFNYEQSVKDTRTVFQNKIIQNTAGLKRFIKNNITYPYGYTGEYYG